MHVPVLAELAQRGAPFLGVLYGGFMLTADGPRVLEFNCRFGDPETQSVLPLLEGDLLGALTAAAYGDLAGVELPASAQAAVTVVIASRDYPERGDAGTPIDGVEAGGGDRRARLPRRHGPPRDAARHQRRARAERDRGRRLARRGT